MKKWYTKYDLPESFNEGKVMDPTNNVDRLTYMDAGKAIEQMKRFGKQTTMIASQAMYHDLDFENDNIVTVPVYALDPVDMGRRVNTLASTIKASGETSTPEPEGTSEAG